VSSIYLHLAGGGIIMDAGEGTYGQLLQRYGRAEIDRIMLHLKLCFISHMHGDHLIGLVSLLLHRTELEMQLRDQRTAKESEQTHEHVDPVVLVAPLDVYLMLQEYNRSCSVPLIFDFVECKAVHFKGHGTTSATESSHYHYEDSDQQGMRALERAMDALGLAKVETAEVIHACFSGARAHAVSLESHAGWKIVYSGAPSFFVFVKIT
jgi:ribonuclease Z